MEQWSSRFSECLRPGDVSSNSIDSHEMQSWLAYYCRVLPQPRSDGMWLGPGMGMVSSPPHVRMTGVSRLWVRIQVRQHTRLPHCPPSRTCVRWVSQHPTGEVDRTCVNLWSRCTGTAGSDARWQLNQLFQFARGFHTSARGTLTGRSSIDGGDIHRDWLFNTFMACCDERIYCSGENQSQQCGLGANNIYAPM